MGRHSRKTTSLFHLDLRFKKLIIQSDDYRVFGLCQNEHRGTSLRYLSCQAQKTTLKTAVTPSASTPQSLNWFPHRHAEKPLNLSRYCSCVCVRDACL